MHHLPDIESALAQFLLPYRGLFIRVWQGREWRNLT